MTVGLCQLARCRRALAFRIYHRLVIHSSQQQKSLVFANLEGTSPCQLSTRLPRSSVISSRNSGVSNTHSLGLASGDLGRLNGAESWCIADGVGAPRKSDGSGFHFPSATSTVTRQVRLCCCLDRLSVGYSLLTVTHGAGIGFFVMLVLGLLIAVSIDCTS